MGLFGEVTIVSAVLAGCSRQLNGLMGGSRPVSRVLSRTAIHLGRTSPCASCNLPGPGVGHTIGSLFGLAPSGVCPATCVTTGAVRSYRTISPLPPRGRFIFCGTFRRLAPPRCYLALCPVEPGLSSPAKRFNPPFPERLSGRLPSTKIQETRDKIQVLYGDPLESGQHVDRAITPVFRFWPTPDRVRTRGFSLRR